MNRKVFIRVTLAPVLVAALGGVIALDHYGAKPLGVTVLVALFSIASYRELCAMARLKGMRPATEVGTLALLLVFATIFWRALRGETLVAPELLMLAYLMVILLLLVGRHEAFSPADAGYSLLGVSYVTMLAFVVAPFAGHVAFKDGLLWLIFLAVTNKGSDMAAYSFGKLFGRHKLAPVVSPNKTWEGAIAGLVIGAGLGSLLIERTSLRSVLATPSSWRVIGMAIAVTVAAQLGDLVKSAIKRWAGVKDSGQLLPEFGGALDMCDSFILSAPVAWALLRVL